MGAFKKVHQNFERLTGDFFCRLARERERERERESTEISFKKSKSPVEN